MASNPEIAGATDTRRFRRNLWLGVLVLNLFALGFVGQALHTSWRGHVERARTATQNISTILDRDIAGIFDNVALALNSLVDDYKEKQRAARFPVADWNLELQRQRSHLPILDGIRGIDAAGAVIYGLGKDDKTNANIADREYFIAHRNNPNAGLLISRPVLSRLSHTWSIVLSRRLDTVDGKFGGVIAATIPLARFSERFASLQLGANSSIAMRDGDLRLIVRYPPLADAAAIGSTHISDAFAAALRQAPNAGSYTVGTRSIDGIERLHSYRRNEAYTFYLNVGIANQAYLAPWYAELVQGAAMACLFMFVTIAFAAQLQRTWRRQQAGADQLAASEKRFSLFMDTLPAAAFIKDSDGTTLYVNRYMADILGARDWLGKSTRDLFPAELAEEMIADDRRSLEAGYVVSEEYVPGADGAVRLYQTHKFAIPRADQPPLLGGIALDITESKAAADQIEHLAFYDPLTDLPNRRLLLDRLHQALSSSSRHNRHGAVLLLDMDDFKTLNDTLGHDVGDQFLVEVAHRLRACVREGDTVARHGGDEFVVILEDLDQDALAAMQAESVAVKILHAISQPYLLDLGQPGSEKRMRSYHCTSSVGITLFRDNSVSVDELMKRADTAMYRAKAAGRNTLRFFDPAMQAEVTARAALDNDLRDAVEANQFVLYFQPQVDAAGRITGAEALIRWQHPERGMVSPAEFIPQAETTGIILPIGQWVLETACEQLAAWAQHPDTAHFTLAVNVSARQFRHPDFVLLVQSILSNTGAKPQHLKLELTESLLLENVEAIIAKMAALKAAGVGFSLDDFGTGYSSLSYLKRLPLDQLKIDQGFVRDILTDPNDAAIAKMVVALADSMGLAVIAEGVEQEAQREFLARQGCHAYQGYLFSRPLPIDEFMRYACGA